MPKKADETKYTAEDAASFTLEQVKQFIEAEVPGAFTKKAKRTAAKKKPAGKKIAANPPAGRAGKKAVPKKKK
jgi:DNA topoisomerase-1